jgi:hypothetical protein
MEIKGSCEYSDSFNPYQDLLRHKTLQIAGTGQILYNDCDAMR